jgi:AcrR family transcriptional regulator
MPIPRRARPRREAPIVLDKPLPATQERSRATTERLLAAAAEILSTQGPNAATLRGIAERAGVSIAIVYRRFPDKDAVLRAVYSQYFSDVASRNAATLSANRAGAASLAELARILVAAIARGYRRDRGLLRALVLYARTHDDAEFRKRAAALNTSALTRMRGLIEAHRDEIPHPNPRLAISFALGAVASVLAERIVFSSDNALPPMSDRRLTSESTRLFLAYLTTAR